MENGSGITSKVTCKVTGLTLLQSGPILFEISYFVYILSFRNISVISAYKNYREYRSPYKVPFFLPRYSSWLHKLLDLASSCKLLLIKLHLHGAGARGGSPSSSYDAVSCSFPVLLHCCLSFHVQTQRSRSFFAVSLLCSCSSAGNSLIPLLNALSLFMLLSCPEYSTHHPPPTTAHTLGSS